MKINLVLIFFLLQAQRTFQQVTRDELLFPKYMVLLFQQVNVYDKRLVDGTCCNNNCDLSARCRLRVDIDLSKTDPNEYVRQMFLNVGRAAFFTALSQFDFMDYNPCMFHTIKFKDLSNELELENYDSDGCYLFYPNTGVIIFDTFGNNERLRIRLLLKYVCGGYYGVNCQVRCEDSIQTQCDVVTGETVCDSGFYGPNCQFNQHPCDSNICQNGGICQRIVSNYRCGCQYGFTGRNCETHLCTPLNCFEGVCLNNNTCLCYNTHSEAGCNVEICVPSTCNGRGQCRILNGATTFVCDCNPSSAGARCELSCPQTCLNGGRCIQRDRGAVCECTSEWTGESCEIRNNPSGPCDTVICLNGGTCFIENSNFACSCTSQWKGELCEISVCKQENCINGNCLTGVGCICLEGFSGSSCESVECGGYLGCGIEATCIPANRPLCVCPRQTRAGEYCQYTCKKPCINGQCVIYDGIVRCICDSGFMGEDCGEQITLGLCELRPCLNEGMCQQLGTLETICICKPQWKGDRCEIPNCGPNNCIRGVCVGPSGCICTRNYQGDDCSVPTCANMRTQCIKSECYEDYDRPKCRCDKSTQTGIYCDLTCNPACSENGYCSVVDGIVGCICDPGWYGETCDRSREFLKDDIIALALIFVTAALIIIGAIMVHYISIHKKEVAKRAQENAMFDPSDILGLKPLEHEEAPITDLYEVNPTLKDPKDGNIVRKAGNINKPSRTEPRFGDTYDFV